ncbi:hypothetical protein BVC93_18810 [Mycobacterium sp. MS1601]|nr:hypothetical protein BVC93_18810 [Mycobacterium sp. MS1601]
MGPIRMAHISWGASLSVVTTHPGAYAVNIPVSGYLKSVIGQPPGQGAAVQWGFTHISRFAVAYRLADPTRLMDLVIAACPDIEYCFRQSAATHLADTAGGVGDSFGFCAEALYLLPQRLDGGSCNSASSRR